MSQAEDNIDDLDLFGVPEMFCESMGKIEPAGPCRRRVFCVYQTIHGKRQRAGVVRLVLPADALIGMAQQLATDIHGAQLRASRATLSRAN